MFDDFHHNGIVNANINETCIALIPKKIDANGVGDCCPVSLATDAYKIIA